MEQSLKDKILSPQPWLRLVFMVLFGIVNYIVQGLFWIIAAVQFVLVIVMGKPNQNLLGLSEGLSAFSYHILKFLAFNVDEKPYPFAPWPHKPE